MKKLLLATVLPAALLASGCQDLCKTGQTLKTNLQTLETTVTGTLASPDAFPNTCAAYDKTDTKMLKGGAAFATRIANDYFTTASGACLQFHYEQRCYLSPAPKPPHFVCDQVPVCDVVDENPEHHDGYQQSLDLATLLNQASADLGSACMANSNGNTLDALAHLLATKGDLHSAVEKADEVLDLAGCNNRR